MSSDLRDALRALCQAVDMAGANMNSSGAIWQCVDDAREAIRRDEEHTPAKVDSDD